MMSTNAKLISGIFFLIAMLYSSFYLGAVLSCSSSGGTSLNGFIPTCADVQVIDGVMCDDIFVTPEYVAPVGVDDYIQQLED